MNAVKRTLGEEGGEDEAAECNSYLLHALTSPLLRNPVGLERPRGSLWPRHGAKKWGRSSPTRCFARGQIDSRAMRNPHAPNHFASPWGDSNGDAKGDLPCLFDSHPPEHPKVTTVEGRSREHEGPFDEIGDGQSGNFFEQLAGNVQRQSRGMGLHIEETKGLESVKMV